MMLCRNCGRDLTGYEGAACGCGTIIAERRIETAAKESHDRSEAKRRRQEGAKELEKARGGGK